MRIATWNIERPRQDKPERNDVITDRINEVDADIWILTETNNCISPGPEFTAIASREIANEVKYYPGENRTTIWSRVPIKSKVKTFDQETAVCAEIETKLGPMLIFGTVLPYGGAATKYPYRSKGENWQGLKGWQLHYESIDEHGEELTQLRRKYPEHLICFGGDLNQSRDGRRWGRGQWYGTNKGRKQLTEMLASVNAACVTEEDFIESGKLTTKSSVDHLCTSQDLADRVKHIGAWEPGKMPGGRRVSDHNGVWIDLG